MKKTRLDVLLVDRGYFETREKAKRTIMAGLVFSEQVRLDKPGMKVETEIPIVIKGKTHNYVSRGGLKLEKALKAFELTVKEKQMIDIGSSTGGFTDCALQNGAKLSYAIDVGQNQLDWKLRNDDRVIVMEKTNFRYVKPEHLTSGRPNFATIDVSFISLRVILPVLKELLLDESDIVALVKPQFEAGREQVGKKGIIKDPVVHKEVITNMIEFSVKEGYTVENLTFSPITGGEGNVEFLLHLKWDQQDGSIKDTIDIEQTIKDAHQELRK
ncbi:TlyA family RNA methyltransferase [Virgibacillus sp. MSP4-1]|uniref:TlyA family RNA methyltransferase n=1 Tax=Virgibacillus sp. MSP4-1 TaxID=2700081 RepID=UPI0003A13928|nr:TlyA family RNA methyltransferase [Virgibacillus sp. MSP4-1]QHS22711.1 TlyA family RNA methyltransferase [Virgibacillus sp. MSP4-1]